MLETGDRAPAFAAPMATPEAAAGGSGEYTGDDVADFELTAALEAGPVVLLFFPGVFSRTCTEELCAVRDWREEAASLDAAAYGVSVDPPYPQLAFIDAYDLSYPLLSGFNNSVVADFGVRRETGRLRGLAERSVFVLAPDRTVEYAWLVEEAGILPDLDRVAAAVEEAA